MHNFAQTAAMPQQYYLLKVRASNKIPSYLQVRDQHFALKYYIRLDRKEKIFQQLNITDPAVQQRLMALLDATPYGKVVPFTLESEPK